LPLLVEFENKYKCTIDQELVDAAAGAYTVCAFARWQDFSA